MAEKRRGMTFGEVVLSCARNAALVREFTRLQGASLGPRATEGDCVAWLAFVYECVWSRLPPEAFVSDGKSGA